MQIVWNLMFTFIRSIQFSLQKNVCSNSDGEIRKWIIIHLIFSIMFDYEWLTFLNFFPSVDLKMGSSLYIVKNQALIANYSMIGLKGCFIQCLSVIFLSRFILKEIFLLKICFPNLFHFQCIFTTGNH